MREARVRVSLTEGILEFEGSEIFVTSQLEKFSKIIHAAFAGEDAVADEAPRETPSTRDSVVTEPPAPPSAPPPTPVEQFKDLFAPTESAVQILTTLPGASTAEKTVNGAKLYLYGLQALKQRDTAAFAEIGRVCKAHGCYDSHNMAASLKGDQTSFVFGGRGKRQTLKLSAPGLQGTADLIARIRASVNGMAARRKGN